MMAKVLLAYKHQLVPRIGREVNIGDKSIALFLLSNASIVAIENYCALTDAPVVAGTVSGENLYEPMKDYKISLTTGKVAPPDECTLKVYPLSIEGDSIYCQVD